MTLEDALFNVLQAAVAAADESDALYGVTVLPTWYDRIEQPAVIRVGDAESDPAPDYPDGGTNELDIVVPLQLVVCAGAEQPQAARDRLQAMQLAVATIINDNPNLSGAVCDCRLLRMRRGWGSVKTVLHAVGVVPVLANATEESE